MSKFSLSAPEAQSPLAHRKAIGNAEQTVRLREVPFVTKITLRGENNVIAAAVSAALGIELPNALGAVAQTGDVRVAWLAPDEWLILAPDDERQALTDKLAASLMGLHHQLVDVSDYDTMIELNGPRAAEMLSRLSTLDLLGDALPEGHATRTRLSQASVTLIRHTGYQIIVRASHADYLWCLLADAGLQYGVPPQEVRSGEPHRF